MMKHIEVSPKKKAYKTYIIRKAIKKFKDQRLKIREMEFALQTDEMYQQINDKINSDFDKLVIDSKIIKRCELLFQQAESNQKRIESLVDEILEIGNESLVKVDDFRDEQFIEQYLRVYQETYVKNK